MGTRARFGVLLTLAGGFLGAREAAAQVSVEDLLKYSPKQPDVEIDIPAAADIPKCKVEVKQAGKTSGYILTGPQGQLLRWFKDGEDADRAVDEFRYYKDGFEVYREVDSNGDTKIDQYRWLNTAGTRWGIDEDQDGTIDSWKVLSPEELSREVIKALASGNEQLLGTLLVNADDLQQLKFDGGLAKEILANVASPGQRMRQMLSQSSVVTKGTKWQRFDGQSPSAVPADAGKAGVDLSVYGNVMAIVDNAGKTGFVQVGEIIKVGDAWKLTQIPRPIDESVKELIAGAILRPGMAAPEAQVADISPEMKALIDQLTKLHANAPKPGDKPAEMSRYNVEHARLLGQLASAGGADAEREQWRRQQIDIIAEATQVDTYPNGLEELARIEETIRKDKQSSLLPHIVFRRVLAGYFVDLNKAEAADRQKVQDGFLKELEQFVTDYPQAEQVPDAMYQLATALDLNGKPTEASIWYGRLMKSYASTEVGERAIGSLRRLQLKGKPLVLAGKGLAGGQVDVSQYRGKVLVVVYWATWCKPCTEDLPALKELYAANKAQGMEVLGVNVDTPDGPIKEYLTEYKVPWPHIAELKGMDCPQAINYGILSVPTMFVVDRTGVCQSVTASLDDLKKVLPELLKK